MFFYRYIVILFRHLLSSTINPYSISMKLKEPPSDHRHLPGVLEAILTVLFIHPYNSSL